MIPSNEALIEEWARVTAETRKRGHPLGQKPQMHDAWIAATARLHDVPLATGNVAHFRDCDGVRLVGPRVIG